MSDNPYLRRQAHKIGRTGIKSEKRLARQMGAKLRPASGALETAKGDMVLGNVLLEAKSTIADSLSIKLDWLVKIAQEARADGRTPALMISFVTPSGAERMDGEWCLIRRRDFEELQP